MRNEKPVVVQIFPHFEGWAVKYQNAERICGAFGTSKEALAFITQQSEGLPVKLMIYDIYGKLRQRLLTHDAPTQPARSHEDTSHSKGEQVNRTAGVRTAA